MDNKKKIKFAPLPYKEADEAIRKIYARFFELRKNLKK